MHPALSVILFTTASGMGYGLLVWLAVFNLAGVLPATRGFGAAALVLALGLITAGLLASTAHLGNPQRAWRALTQWRTSWLSREGVVSLAVYPFALTFAGGWVLLGRTDGAFALAGALAAALALLTLVCTAQIYASLKPIPAWRNAWTVPNYLGLGLSSGAGALLALLALGGHDPRAAAAVTLLATGVALVLKLAYWRHVDAHPGTLTPADAIGVTRFGTVRTLDPPHTQANYVQREMGFAVARKHAARLRQVALAGAFGAPALAALACLALPGVAGTVAAVAALPLLGAGLLTERWLLFAQARHLVTLYYGATRA